MRILCFMAHPDDMEVHCAGTLLRYVQDGHTVFSCHVANGNMGDMVTPPDELRRIRIAEAKKAGALAGIEVLTLDLGDLTINGADERQYLETVRLLRQTKPDVILTHAPEDYCSDHTAVSELVFRASFSATCPNFHPELGGAAPLASVYYAANGDSINFIPTEYVDISDVMETKLAMMKCHESQLVWLKEHDNSDILRNIQVWAEAWGTQCGVKYAECFRPLMASGRMRTWRVLP